MSLVNIFQPRPAARSKRSRKPAALGLTVLEARCNPVTTLVDTNADVLAAADGSAEILTTTPDGRYAVFSSTAADVVPGQNDTPGTRDLFWVDFLTGRRELVTNAPNDDGKGGFNYNGEVTFGRRFAGVESFGNGRARDAQGNITDNTDVGRPVISDDGQVVAFISKVNAGFLDPRVATTTQLSSSAAAGNKRTLDADRGNTTYDVYRWNRSDGAITLMSRTFPRFGQNGKAVEAFGIRTPATNPAVSADGSVVAFLSKRDAADVYAFNANPDARPVVDSVDSTNDLFYTDFEQVGRDPAILVSKNTTTVMSKVENPYGNEDLLGDFGFFFRAESATFGYLNDLSPLADDFNLFGPIFDVDGNLIGFSRTQPDNYGAQISVQVDPLGRYLSSDGKTATFLSDTNPLWVTGVAGARTIQTYPAGGRHRDVYLANLLNTDEDTETTFRIVTQVNDQPNPPGKPADLMPTAGLRQGDSDNSIIVRNNADAVAFTFTVGSKSGVLIPDAQGINALPTASGATMQLYFAEHPVGSQIPDTILLVSANDNGNGTPTTPTANATAIPGNLALDPDAQGSSPPTDPRGYQLTPDGRFIAFTGTYSFSIRGNRINQNNSTATGAAGGLNVFRRELRPQPIVSASGTPTGDSSFYANGALLRISQRAGSTPGAANGASTNPTLTPDGRYVAFQNVITSAKATAAANLVTGLGTTTVSQVYVRDTAVPAPTRTGRLPTGQTFLVSQNKDGTGFGDQASVRPFAGSFGGEIGRVLFTSSAGNLITFPPVTSGTDHGYNTDLPIVGGGGDGPDTTSTDTGAVSGGLDGGVTFANFTGRGLFDFGDRFTPFPGFGGEVRVAAADVNGDTVPDLIAGPGPGGGPRVRVIDGATGGAVLTYAVVTDSVAGTVTTTTRTFDFFAFESSFTGGVYVAAADINNDGFADVIVGAGEGGGSRIQVYSGRDGRKVADFFAYEATFRGGVRIAAGDTNQGTDLQSGLFESFADIASGAGLGGGPRISVLDGEAVAGAFPRAYLTPPAALTLPDGTPTAGRPDDDMDIDSGTQLPRVRTGTGFLNTTPGRLVDFFAFEPSLRNGVNVGVGDLNGDGIMDVVTGAGPGGGPRVLAFDSPSLLTNTSQATVLANLFAFDSSSRNGVRVAVRDIDGDGVGDLIAGQGAGSASRVRSYSVGATLGSTPEMIDDQLLFDDFASLNGAWVG